MKVILNLKLKVDTTRYAQRSIYNNFVGGIFGEPCSLAELEDMCWIARIHLETLLRDRKLIIPELMKVYVLREDEVHHNRFVVLYPEIGIKPLAHRKTSDHIVQYIASPPNPTPCAKTVMDQWKLRKWLEDKDQSYLGLPAPIDYNTMFKIRETDWSHYKLL